MLGRVKPLSSSASLGLCFFKDDDAAADSSVSFARRKVVTSLSP